MRWLAVPCLCAALGAPLSVGAQEAATAVYVRTDSDETTVITPRLRVKAPVGTRTSAQLVYTVDVWTSASIDIRTSASLAVTEQRDELDVTLEHELDGVRLSADYRYSTEPDYESHGGSVAAEVDLANKSATVAASASANFDDVGRVGDPLFSEDVQAVSGRLSLTQILDPDTLVQGVYQLTRTEGYQASPYRYVGIGSDDGTCEGLDVPCIPEANPELRVAHAFALRGRRALSEVFSVGGSYRLYLDDWSMMSHTLQVDGGAWLDAATLVALRYRLYLQNGAEHYQPSYDELEEGRAFYPRDKELSPLSAHRVGLDLTRNWELDASGQVLSTVLSVGPTFYSYSDYRLLDSVTAFEVTLTGALTL